VAVSYFEIAETGAILELLYLKEMPPPEQTIGRHWGVASPQRPGA
jgi:hypothetical protein